MATALHANGLSATACPTDTLANYELDFGALSTACANGILNFSNFNFQLYQSSGSGTVLNASQIELTPVGTADQTGVTGFSITGLNGPIAAAAGQDVTYVVDWDFVIDAGPIAGGASLGMDPPSGDITITQYYCLDSNFQNGQTYNGSAPTCSTSLEGTVPAVQTLSVSTTNPDDICADDDSDYCNSITFDPPAQDYANVMTVIQLTGGDEGADFDSVNGNSEILPAAPEPGTLLLIPGAVFIFLFIRRRAVTL